VEVRFTHRSYPALLVSGTATRGCTNDASTSWDRDKSLSNKLFLCGKRSGTRLHLLRARGCSRRRPAATRPQSRWNLRVARYRRSLAGRGLACEDPSRDHRQCPRLHRLLLQPEHCPY